jgi:hypothetical protein
MNSFIQHYGYFALFVALGALVGLHPDPLGGRLRLRRGLCTTAVTGHVQFTLWAVIVVGTDRLAGGRGHRLRGGAQRRSHDRRPLG